MSARIYVAAKYEEKRAARAAMRACEKAGHKITFDWTKGRAPVSSTLQEAAAYKDLDGVRRADFVIALAHPHLYGTMLEVGFALGCDLTKPVFLVGEIEHDSVFFHVRRIIKVETVKEALAQIERRLKR